MCLLEDGDKRDVVRAERVINEVVTAQKLNEGNPRYGNFRWIYEDKVVTDRNAVLFTLAS